MRPSGGRRFLSAMSILARTGRHGKMYEELYRDNVRLLWYLARKYAPACTLDRAVEVASPQGPASRLRRPFLTI